MYHKIIELVLFVEVLLSAFVTRRHTTVHSWTWYTPCQLNTMKYSLNLNNDKGIFKLHHLMMKYHEVSISYNVILGYFQGK